MNIFGFSTGILIFWNLLCLHWHWLNVTLKAFSANLWLCVFSREVHKSRTWQDLWWMLNRRVQPVILSRPEATCCAIAFKKVVCGELAKVTSDACDVGFKAVGTFYFYLCKLSSPPFLFLSLQHRTRLCRISQPFKGSSLNCRFKYLEWYVKNKEKN